MKRVLALIFLSVTLAQANDETTIELPGGVPLEMVWIEPGRFTMGSPEVGVTPREVTISQGFYLGKYEITQEQWQAVMGTSPWSSWRSGFQGPRLPAGISWHDAQAFAQRLNDHFGEDAYRLPTEAEWEYACRAGTTTRWFFGDDKSLLGSYAWYKANARDAGRDHFHPVGEKLPNPWRLFDMYGNAWEWVYNWYDYNAHDGTPQTDPTGPVSGHYRVQKGGAYYVDAQFTAGAYNRHARPESQSGGARLLKGTPLNIVIPEHVPFPQDSSGSFFPDHEGNIWIMAALHRGKGPPSVDTTAFVLRSQIIEGKQYWEWEGYNRLFSHGPFRVDETGIWELIPEGNRQTYAFIRGLLKALDERPELRESQYYRQSSFFQSLDPDQEELLLFDFAGGAIGEDSPTQKLDEDLRELHWSFFSSGMYVQKNTSSNPYQLSFSWTCCGTEVGGEIILQRGLGPVRSTGASVFGGETIEELVWARIDGSEYGLHPGPDYPGNRQIETVVASPELTFARPVASGLSPNFPNPFNASTRIAYRLATPGLVRLVIYNTLGQPLRTLVDHVQTAGTYQVHWDALDQGGARVAAGVYFTRLHHPGGVQTRRLLYLK